MICEGQALAMDVCGLRVPYASLPEIAAGA